MDRRDRLDDATDDAPRPRPAQPPWVKLVAIGVIALVVLATVASALLA